MSEEIRISELPAADTLTGAETYVVVQSAMSKRTTGNEITALAVAAAEASSELKINLTAIVDDLTTGGTDAPLSAQQGVFLKGLVDGLTAILDADDVDLDTAQERIDFIKNLSTELDGLAVADILGLQAALDAASSPTATETTEGIVELATQAEVDSVTTDNVVRAKHLKVKTHANGATQVGLMGGNALGANAINIQTSRSSASQVASGSNSVNIGINGTSSGTNGINTGYGGINTGYAGINTGYGGTNTGYAGTNSGYAGNNSGNYGINTGYGGNNSGDYGTNSGDYGTNTGIYGTNTGIHGTNSGTNGTNTGAYGTNSGTNGTNSGAYGINSGIYGANTGIHGTNSGYGGTNTGAYGTNSGDYGTNTGDYGTNTGYGGNNSGNRASTHGYFTNNTVDNVQELAYWSNANTRVSSIRLQGDGQAALTIRDSATAPTDGGATAGSEADGTLGRGMYCIQRNGAALTLYYNDAGTISSQALKSLTATEKTKLDGIEAGATADQDLSALQPVVNNVTEAGATRTLVAGDVYKNILATAVGGLVVTVNNSVFDVDDIIEFTQGDAGAITFDGTVTINNHVDYLPQTDGQYAVIALRFTSATEAILIGQLELA